MVATNDYQALEGFFQLITFDFDVASEFWVLQSSIHPSVDIGVNVDTDNKPAVRTFLYLNTYARHQQLRY